MSRDFSQLSQSFVDDAPSAPPSPELNLDIKRLLFVRAPLMIAIAIVLGIPAVLAAWFLTPTEYEATAVLRFRAVTPIVMVSDRREEQEAPYEKYVSTQIALIQNDTILGRLLDSPEIMNLPLIAKAKDPLELLKDDVQVRRTNRDSELVSISFSAKEKATAEKIVASIVTNYQAYDAAAQAKAGGDRMQALLDARDAYVNERGRLLDAKTDAAKRMEAPIELLSQLNLTEIETQRSALIDEEKILQKTKTAIARTEETILQIKALQAQYDADPGKEIYEFGVEELVRQDNNVSALRSDVQTSEVALQSLSVELRQGNPRLDVAQKKYSALKSNLKRTESQVRGEILLAQLLAEQKILEAGKQSEAEQQELVDKRTQIIEKLEFDYQVSAEKAAAADAELAEMDHSIEDTTQRLSEVRKQIDVLALESNAPARVQVASPAQAPNFPNTGKRLRFAVLAFMAAIAFGIGMGILREITDSHIHTPKDIASLTQLSVLATIPHAKEDKLVDATHAHLAAAEFPYSLTANEYRRILSRITYPPDSAIEINTLLIASPSPGDGKTSVACNLAVLLARANRRVLLIDTCGSDRTLEHCFDLPDGPGLSEVLYENADPLSLVSTVEPNLDVLGPGLRGQDISGKLVSHEMIESLEGLEHEYDHILLDTVPGLLMSDAKLLAPVVDGVILVVGSKVSIRGMVRRFLRDMEQANADVLGIVMNRVRTTRGGYMRRNLDMYYGYSDANGNGAARVDDVVDIEILDEYAEEEAEPAFLLMPEDGDIPVGDSMKE